MRIFYDVDTQNDFMNADGALPVPNAGALKPSLARLTAYAKGRGLKIVGSVDRHFGTEEYREKEGELQRWGGPFPDHCMDGTEGQKKIVETAVEGALYIPSDRIELPGLGATIQIIFEKQSYDVFKSEENLGGNANVDAVLERLGVTEAVLYGVATDYCDKAAAIGMQNRGIQVYVVQDAIAAVNVKPRDGEKAIEAMGEAGARFVTTAQVLEDKL